MEKDILQYANANTVSSVNQMQHGSFFGDPCASHPRILFVGNSITLHGIKEDIGWPRQCGMAASDEAHDYVHLTMNRLIQINPKAGYAIAQAALWEREYWHPEEALKTIEGAREWNADIIVLRLSENTPLESLKDHDYLSATVDFMNWLSPDGHARYVVTDGFWPNPQKDRVMYQAAQEKNAIFVSLADLGMRKDTKALGLFAHEGVASHPGDLGMEKIAERLFGVLKDLI